MDDYLKNGLQFTKGQPANVKMALAYNYICNKYEFSLEPITSGGKLNDAKTEIEWNIAELEKGNNV